MRAFQQSPAAGFGFQSSSPALTQRTKNTNKIDEDTHIFEKPSVYLTSTTYHSPPTTTTMKRKKPSPLVQSLLDQMTIDDKIGQMTQIEINMLLSDDKMSINESVAEYFIGEYGAGSVLNTVPVPWTAQDYRSAAIQLNRIAQKYHRPPVIWGLDSVHGANYVHGASIPPQPINMAATFNTTVAYEAGRIASRDTRAAGINWLFSPLVGIALEPKWPRVYETFGEDPVVVGEMAKALVEGIQAPGQGIPSRAAACGKHWIGYSKPLHGNDRSPSWIPTRHLYQYFVPPWKKVLPIVKTVMESYTETDGVPNVANSQALHYLLRGRMQYDGVLVTDYQEIINLADWHHTAPSSVEAAGKAMAEGTVDMSMVPWDTGSFHDGIVGAIERKLTQERRLDESVRRVLQLKEDLAMFDEDIQADDPNLDLVGGDREDVLHMAHQSIILAKNEEKMLPRRSGKVLVTGPTAHSLIYQTGGWTFQWQGVDEEAQWFTYGTTVLDAFKSVSDFTVEFSCGVSIYGGDCDDERAKEGIVDQLEDLVGLGSSTSIERATKAADHADMIVVCVGEPAYAEKPGDIRGEELPSGQYELVRRLREKSSADIVLVYFGGRPRLLKDMVENVDAALVGFLPGPDAGQALVDIITGKVNPSGRMPLTYPKLEDNSGVPYFHSVSDKCINPENKWDYTSCEVEWLFGHGLSYTTFTYSSFTGTGGIDDDLHLSVKVKNDGDVDGEEVVLFFTFDQFRQTTPEYKLLRAFRKISLRAGEEKVVSVTVEKDDLSFVGPDDDRHYIFDPKMKSYAGVGATTDCRADPTDNLCVELVGRALEKSHVPACNAACEIWESSGCLKQVFSSFASCIDSCHASDTPDRMLGAGSNQGWGWNYVDCIEFVSWGFNDSSSGKACWKLTSLCRDVLETDGFDRFGMGPSGYSPATNDSAIGNTVALFAGLVATILIVVNFRRRKSREEQVEFAMVDTVEA